MINALTKTDFFFPGQTNFYKGKVRDVYTINNDLIVMVASDRISAFDVILPKGIPYKGQVLNQVANYFLESTRDICPNWLLDSPDPNVAVGYACEPIRIEMVIRGYLSGHAWREYQLGKRSICGVQMPEGMKENDRFLEPIITPAAKSLTGHDVDISREEIIRQNLMGEVLYEQLENYTRALFKRGSEMAVERGLILVDTKYEFGMRNGRIYLIDEIHTPDSSRYFYADTYEQIQNENQKQRQLSKEFVREWLIKNNFQGLEGQIVPEMTDDFIAMTSERYIELFEKITGKSFDRVSTSNSVRRIKENVEASLLRLNT